MNYAGRQWDFIRCLELFPITTHLTAGELTTYSYGGQIVTYNSQPYSFLASGITDPTTIGGFNEYTAETSRTIPSVIDRENYVNFYYCVGLSVFAWTYAGYHQGLLVTGPSKISGYGFFVGADEWNSLITYIRERYSARGWSQAAYPMTNVSAGQNLTAALFNQVKNAIGSKVGTGIADKIHGNPILAADLNTLANSANLL